MLLKAGDRAPVFSLPDSDMETVDLATCLGAKHVVLFFYPKDGTPGCTIEATDFSDHEDEFGRENCLILGVNRDDCFKHAEFRDREGIGISLLSDVEGAVCKLYGVWQSKEVDGHKKFCIARSTFIIDRAGVVRHALYNVNYKGHAQEVLRLVKELNP
ncbi:MAG: peroxiredoxin [Betaproteobacteria bacterium]